MIVGADQFSILKSGISLKKYFLLARLSLRHEKNQYDEMLEFKAEHPKLKDVVVSEFDVIDISSSQIRDMIKRRGCVLLYPRKRK